MSGIKNNLRKIRKANNLSQKELEKLSGVHYTYISRIENGAYNNPSLDVLQKLANALKCSVDELTGEKKIIEEVFPEKFDDPQEARFFVRKHQVFEASDFDASKLTDEEIIEFANEVLGMMKLMTYKYKK